MAKEFKKVRKLGGWVVTYQKVYDVFMAFLPHLQLTYGFAIDHNTLILPRPCKQNNRNGQLSDDDITINCMIAFLLLHIDKLCRAVHSDCFVHKAAVESKCYDLSQSHT